MRSHKPIPSQLLPVSLATFLLAMCLCLLAGEGIAASSLAQLERDLVKEQEKAAERRQSLARMTEEERKLNANLATVEKRILEIERGLAQQQNKLLEIGTTDDKVRIEYEALLKEQKKTEQAQSEALRLLWEVTGKRILVGGRDMTDWAEADRDFAWSRELLTSLEAYRKKLDAQEAELSRLLGRREKLSREMQQSVSTVNEEKSRLLKARLEYDRKLAEVRRKRVSEEAELNNTLKLVNSLNFQISRQTTGDITKMKGRLIWPVQGSPKLRYNPKADPPRRGLGFATADKAQVRAVAAGKVVHNDVLRGFGTVLILQHGDDYYSLYAFLGSCPLRVGQDVNRQEVIGTAGFYPAIKGTGMYFELRFKQKAINPEPWFASR